MYEFHYYNSEQPQIITSFKGNQKLILGGYRYNIHHVKEGVKTWRCVCAKKLTGARSWCKGRAETWEGDTKGIPKGEHNHQTEHDLAELEYFKSQLIFAAISDPSADLNLLIDEATKFLSQGLSFGNRESMKKSLIVARKSAESGELKLGQQPHRSIKGVKRTSVRSKASIPSATLRSSSAMNKNGAHVQNTPSNILSQSSQSSSRQKSTPINRTINSPFSPIISSGSRSNNSSGIGSSLSSDCLDTSCFSSMGCNTQSNNWNQNYPFEMPSSSGLNNTFSEGGEASSSINSYGTVNVSMPSEQILAAALFAAAMLGSTQVPQNQNQQQNQQFQETVNNPALPIPSKRARGNNTSITISRVTTNGAAPMQAITALTNSVAKLTHPQGINLKRKGARVNGILQKLSTKAAADNNNTFSPPALKMPMEIKKEELNTNTVAIKGKEELDSNPMAQKRLLVSVQTQTDNSEAEMKRFTNEKHNPSENGKAEMNGFNHQYPPKRLICCCCYDEADSFNSDEFPVGCKRRAKFLLENKEQKHYKDWNKSLSPSSPIIIKEGKEEKQSEDNNNATSISGMELFESDNDLKLEIEEEDEEENEDLGLNKCY